MSKPPDKSPNVYRQDLKAQIRASGREPDHDLPTDELERLAKLSAPKPKKPKPIISEKP